MIRAILILIAGLVTSFFLFPFDLPVSLTINTKMVLAVLGAGVFFLDRSLKRNTYVSKDLIELLIIPVFVSIWAFFITSVCETNDYSYATYVASVSVWFFAAYFVVWLVKQIHGSVDLKLIGYYLVGVCVFQCVLAYLISLSPSLEAFENSIAGHPARVQGRLYGMGAHLDPAGLRFSGVLIITAHLITQTDFDKQSWKGFILFIAFLILSVIGNMIARTTTVGMVVGLVYIIVMMASGKSVSNSSSFLSVTLPISVLLLLLCIWLYQTDISFHKYLRFGFEGFFSLAEKGKWEVHSNDILMDMVVWPESIKTWIIGDGFFMSPLDNPNRFGQISKGFYMHTDIGYLRFIFYFGTIGLLGMICVFFKSALICIRSFLNDKWLFILLLLVNLIGWLKVSSDIIMVFAPFLILAFQKDLIET